MTQETHFRYCFVHNARQIWFGPYQTEEEAKERFQRKYGYWPEDALNVQGWEAAKREFALNTAKELKAKGATDAQIARVFGRSLPHK